MRATLDWLVRRTPLAHRAAAEGLYWYRRWRAGSSRPADFFAYLSRARAWGGAESLSGPGSDLAQTARLIEALPRLLAECGARTLLDLPCGDFHWMSRVDLSGVEYVGADVVAELIDRNRAFRSPSVSFEVLDLLASPLPRVDLMLCRDCLVHLSFADARRAVENICRCQDGLLLATTFTRHDRNRDVRTGCWRPLNLELPPFNFPPPRRVLEEGCAAAGRADKALGLWAVADLRGRPAAGA